MAKVAVSKRGSDDAALALMRDRVDRTSLRSIVGNRDALIETAVHTSVETRRRLTCVLLVNRPDGIDAVRELMRKRHGVEHKGSIEKEACIALNTQKSCMRLRESEYLMIAMYGEPDIAKAAIDELATANYERAYYELFIISKRAKTAEARTHASTALGNMPVGKEIAERLLALMGAELLTLDHVFVELEKPDVEVNDKRLIGFFRRLVKEDKLYYHHLDTGLAYMPLLNALLEMGAEGAKVKIVLDQILYVENMGDIAKTYMNVSEALGPWLDRNHPDVLRLIKEWINVVIRIITDSKYGRIKQIIPAKLIDALTVEKVFLALCPDEFKQEIERILESKRDILDSDLLTPDEKRQVADVPARLIRYGLNMGLLVSAKADGGLPEILAAIPAFEKLTEGGPDAISEIIATRLVTRRVRRFQVKPTEFDRAITELEERLATVERMIREEENGK